jgi:hypothetical protein
MTSRNTNELTMKKTTDNVARRFVLTLLAVLTTTIAFAQLDGKGTENEPYLINNAEDWASFTNMINGGTGTTAYYELTNDIILGTTNDPITSVVGTNDKMFKGTFDGGFHTIYLNMNREANYAAPFGVTCGATIKNLHVDGTIVTDHKFAAGIVAYSNNIGNQTTRIINCISSVYINCDKIVTVNASKPNDCTHGGLVGQNEKGSLYFENCIFDGTIRDSKATKTAVKCTGFVGWVNDKVTYKDCIMAGTIDVKPNDNSLNNSMATYHRLSNTAKAEYENVSYFINDYTYSGLTEQGVQAPSVVPANVISRQFSANNKHYYIAGAEFVKGTIDFLGWRYDTDNGYTYNLEGGSDGINYVYTKFGYTTTFAERYDLQIDGNWDVATNWKYELIPTNGGDVLISADVTIPGDYNAKVDDIIVSTKASVTIENGAQFISKNPIDAVVYKNILSSDLQSKHAWNTIASPIKGQAFSEVEGLTSSTTTHNIYKYDETTPMWVEYRDGNNGFDVFENGRGYIYRTTFEGNIRYAGTINAEDVNYSLTYTNDHGFNLIGNPFTHDIYKGIAFSNTNLVEGYCVLESTGTWTYKEDDKAIPSGTAFMVLANDDVDITIKNTDEKPVLYSKSSDNNVWFTVNNDEYTDVACIKFKDGEGFSKLAHYNTNAPMLYINYNGEHYAAANVQSGVKTAALCFKSQSTGKYTLNIDVNGDFSYLHLIDRLTGKDVDLLIADEYTFISTSNDNAERFIVEFDYAGNEGITDNENFAWQNGSDIVVNGEGELQMYDMMGRMVMTQHINGVQTVNVSSEGVYILKLNEKVQKIFVK